MHVEQIYDYESCANIYIGELIVTDGQNQLKIEMKGIHVDLKADETHNIAKCDKIRTGGFITATGSFVQRYLTENLFV